ncbi:neocarzinostatin apoprotein domain-containing protein [Streptomyces sp. NBC_00503]|uniref:neocarzinostatin apoprotein domain-containing protein n=1 Tax=Streptomyces sp. NBC_00503 TaxID=2903659 RepID=UPI002E815216|nr:neocarzinostatin apoprotein domain-containing protein [Streptomyces sp. NBC_00503]WUD79398.1 neocarzinostatin apoprotein domain-containing protein [Streptomyces sp. NBC_00503]
MDRADGRISQVQLFYDATATGGLPFVWQREQDAPDTAYGPWRRVSAVPVGEVPVGGAPSRDVPVGEVLAREETAGARHRTLGAVENAAGSLEVGFAGRGAFCRTVQGGGTGGGWSVPAVGRIQPNPAQQVQQVQQVAAGAASSPRLDVRRTTGLLDGDVVKFSIAGGPAKAYVWVKQCAPSTTAATAATCDDATGRQFRVYPDGTYELSPKKLYARLETPAGSFDCRAAAAGRPCSLALTDNDGVVLTSVPLRFRPHGGPEAPPTLRVSPDSALVDGQTVRATGAGYEPQYHSLVMECAAGSTDTLGCRPRSRPPATDDGGRLDEQVFLSAAFTSIDGRAVDCRVAGGCELVVFGTRVRGPEWVRRALEFAPAAG